MMQVFHRIEPDFFADHKPSLTLNEYKKVADVDCDNIDKAYELTNHIDRNWVENSEVKAVVGRHRSTSMGDVVVDDSGTVWWCKSIGWEMVKRGRETY